jgi:hypothetical protein
MPLNATQRLQARKHLKVWPEDTILDASIATLEDGGPKEAELTAALALCETRLAALDTVEGQVDELTGGGGATFNYSGAIAAKKRLYDRAVEDLARLLGVDLSVWRGTTEARGWRVR